MKQSKIYENLKYNGWWVQPSDVTHGTGDFEHQASS